MANRYPMFPKLIIKIKEKGLTRKEVAESVGISKSKMTRIIYGEIVLTLDLAMKIAERLETNVNALFK